ncbi:LysM peptidoglycan-binding domain-containing protein [Gaetbulibacter aestuarii]|uniref:LysM peptidoglycan-binding domain-containing protein n=1 Tax=Gaetbulibacter aestuarii TaxID=1502358 RepID=A0ABW7N2D6_9FLAO
MKKLFLVSILVFFFGIQTLKAQNFSTHQVKEGETVESIAKKYYVTPSDIYTYNPDAKKGLKPNTILIIPISKANAPKVVEKRELTGFKEHKVRRKETLYSLAKEYHVDEEDIKQYNRSLYAKPLQKGDKIQIPVYKITEVVEENPDFKTYIVQPKEGKWRVAYKFGITIDQLEELNPDMGEVLQEGQELKVPNIEKDAENKVDYTYSYYKVLPKEGFYRLKLKLGLDETQLDSLNPGLKESGLKAGMILKVPYGKGSTDLVDETASYAVNLVDSISDYNEKHIAVMLPFRLNRVEFDSVNNTKRSIKTDPYLKASLDFYSGVLMALDSLKTLGISVKVDVFDTKNELSRVSSIIVENDFENMDAVIGPLISNNFEKASSELRRTNVPIFSPIGTNLNLYDNVFQTRPSDDLLKEKVVNYVKKDTSAANVLIITDSKHINTANELKNDFSRAQIIQSRKNKDGEDVNYVLVDDIKDHLKPGNNKVFLETENAGFASNVTSVLASLIQKENKEEELPEINIRLYTTNFNSAFTGDEISNEHLSKLQFSYATGSRSYSDIEPDSFVKHYARNYNITPNKWAVKGFDLTMDVVLRLVSSENLYQSVIKAPMTEYVENKFAYKKKLFGGYYNDTAYLVKYDQLNIVVVEQ